MLKAGFGRRHPGIGAAAATACIERRAGQRHISGKRRKIAAAGQYVAQALKGPRFCDGGAHATL